MSKAPTSETHWVRAPVLATIGVDTLQVVEALSATPSGVPRAATVHSALVGSRLKEFRAAAAAWNQVMKPAGLTPAIDTAYTLVQPLPVGAQPAASSSGGNPELI